MGEQPVIWHDHQISATKCKDTATEGENFPYVGNFIANLTLAEVKVPYPLFPPNDGKWSC